MSNDTPTTEWQKPYLERCRKTLGISENWRITLAPNDQLVKERETDASVDVKPRLLEADIYVASDTQNDPMGRERIVHEMIHVALNELSEVVRATMDNLPDDARKTLEYLYDGAEERFITRLARAMAQEPFEG